MVVFFMVVCFTYVCICQLHLRHVHHRRNPLCNGRRRRRQCCKCTWDTRLTLGYSCPQHWGQCCYCSCRHGMPWLDHFHQEGPQRSHHHIVHTSYLETVKVRDDHVLYWCCFIYYIESPNRLNAQSLYLWFQLGSLYRPPLWSWAPRHTLHLRGRDRVYSLKMSRP